MQFDFRSTIDFIEVEIHLAAPTSLKSLQAKLPRILGLAPGRRASVDLVDRGDGGEFRHFKTRIQDPANWLAVTRVLKGIIREFNLAAPPRITAVEIALDAYRKPGTTHQELAEMAAHLYRARSQRISGNARLNRDYKGSGQEIPAHFGSLARHLAAGWQINIGNSNERYGPIDPVCGHVYVKTTDDGGADLPHDQHRARFEIRIQGAALPQTLSEWSRFKFESLCQPDQDGSRLFHWLKLKVGAEDSITGQWRASSASQLDERKQRWKKGGGSRLFAKDIQADTELNKLARVQLRMLTKRWAAGQKKTGAKLIPAPVDCGERDLSAARSPNETGHSPFAANNYPFKGEEHHPVTQPTPPAQATRGATSGLQRPHTTPEKISPFSPTLGDMEALYGIRRAPLDVVYACGGNGSSTRNQEDDAALEALLREIEELPDG